MIDTTFREAKQDFQNFLSGQGLSSDLLWVFREDVISLPNRLLIKVPLPENNETLAATCYEIGRERNFGLCLHAFCLLDGRPCCYIQLPKDDLDAQYMLLNNENLKYSVWTDLKNAEPIAKSLHWRVYRLTRKFSDTRFAVSDELPLREECFQAT